MSTLSLSGFYTTINPAGPVPLAGYTNRTSPYTSIADTLETNAICLNSGHKKFLLVSTDCLYLPPNFLKEITSGNIQLCAGASHTHFAPALDPTKPALGKVNDLHFETTINTIKSKITTLLSANTIAATLTYSSASMKATINRRRKVATLGRNPFKWHSHIELGPNWLGRTNSTIHILTFRDENQKIAAVVWSFACHPTNWPGFTEISSDYIGVVRSQIRKKYGNIPVVFYQGFSGNVVSKRNKFGWTPKEISDELLRKRLLFKPFTLDGYIQWSNELAQNIVNTLSTPGTAVHIHEPEIKTVNIPLQELITGQLPETEFLQIQEVSLGNNLSMVCFSAEPVAEYESIIKSNYKNKIVIPVGCTGSVYGYLPTNRIIREGGYEGGDFFNTFGNSCNFKPDVEKQIRKGLAKLVTM